MDVGQQEWITRMRLSDYFYLQGVDKQCPHFRTIACKMFKGCSGCFRLDVVHQYPQESLCIYVV